VASSALDDDVVHDIVRLMFEHKNALVAAHPEARHLSLPPSPDAAPAPFHSGAERYYREHAWK
jgi:TRAP-type uncharacterized transport system substrate-binding protein